MTAICIVRGDDAIVIASDGAGYDDNGRLLQITNKVSSFPHLNMLVTSTGSGLAQHYFHDSLFWHNPLPETFDEVLIIAEDLARKVAEDVRRDGAASTHNFSLYLCGFSDARGRPETYAIKSRDWPDVPGPDGELQTAPAFTLVPLPAIHSSPRPPVEYADAFGIQVPGINMTEMPPEGARYAMASVAACRFVPGGPDHEQAKEDPFCCVGGFLQVTILRKNYVEAQIAHRWPDRLGERMDPWRGEPHEKVPQWLLPPTPTDEPVAE